MQPGKYASVRAYVGFDEATSELLAAFHEPAHPHFSSIVDDFYSAIERHPDAVAAIAGGREQVERLKLTLIEWLESGLRGPHDDAYLARRAKIGRVHVRIALPQEFMFSAMNRIRARLLGIAESAVPEDRRSATRDAINQLLDLELAIMLDTYREDLVDRMRAKERLATVGQLAATIGHELRNPLGAVQSSLFLIKKRIEKIRLDDATLEKHHNRIAQQVAVCGTTISNLLELARHRPPSTARVQLAPVVQSAITAAQLPKGVTTESTLPQDIAVDADPDQLRQVLVNLLTNAGEALAGQGTIHVSASVEAAGVAIRVADDGPGIPAESQGRIFEALYTTKSTGTGLGLALCERVVTAHGGTIGAEPTATGASFRVWLPNVGGEL